MKCIEMPHAQQISRRVSIRQLLFVFLGWIVQQEIRMMCFLERMRVCFSYVIIQEHLILTVVFIGDVYIFWIRIMICAAGNPGG